MRTLLLLAALLAVTVCRPWGRGRGNGNFDRRRRLEKPNFFKSGRSKSVFSEYQKVVTTYDNVPDRDAAKQFRGWYDKQPPEFKKDFDDYREDCRQELDREEKKHRSAIQTCSPAAQEADKKLVDICNNEDYSQEQKLTECEKLQLTLPPEVQKELDNTGDSYYEVVVTVKFILVQK